MENLTKFFQKKKKKITHEEIEFITQFKIEFLLPLPMIDKCFEKAWSGMPNIRYNMI